VQLFPGFFNKADPTRLVAGGEGGATKKRSQKRLRTQDGMVNGLLRRHDRVRDRRKRRKIVVSTGGDRDVRGSPRERNWTEEDFRPRRGGHVRVHQNVVGEKGKVCESDRGDFFPGEHVGGVGLEQAPEDPL